VNDSTPATEVDSSPALESGETAPASTVPSEKDSNVPQTVIPSFEAPGSQPVPTSMSNAPPQTIAYKRTFSEQIEKAQIEMETL
jgi:hypothetical protein